MFPVVVCWFSSFSVDCNKQSCFAPIPKVCKLWFNNSLVSIKGHLHSPTQMYVSNGHHHRHLPNCKLLRDNRYADCDCVCDMLAWDELHGRVIGFPKLISRMCCLSSLLARRIGNPLHFCFQNPKQITVQTRASPNSCEKKNSQARVFPEDVVV